jgi:signal transduction histidine kinase
LAPKGRTSSGGTGGDPQYNGFGISVIKVKGWIMTTSAEACGDPEVQKTLVRPVVSDGLLRPVLDKAGRDGATSRVSSRTLNRQFLGMSTAMLLLGMLAQGAWIASTIREKATYHATLAAVVFIDHFIAPHITAATVLDPLPPELHATLAALRELALPTIQVVSMHVWTKDGKIIHSTNPRRIGQSFLPSAALRAAAMGVVTSELDQRQSNHNAAERSVEQSLLEVYVPVRNAANQIVAVVEFYLNADRLAVDLIRTQREAWFVTAAVFLVMIAGLWLIFAGAGSIIDSQRRILLRKVGQLSDLLRQNHDLQQRVARSSRRAAAEHERILLSLGADLHDGPTQSIGYALLRLDALVPSPDAPQSPASTVENVESIRHALTEAMAEVRQICAGLSMPEIQSLSLSAALEKVIRRHEQRTHTTVQWDILTDLPTNAPHFVKVSLCRFVQEGLNNAFRHARGSSHTVQAWTNEGSYFVKVEDEGGGMNAEPSEQRLRLGLAGLTNRLESWGGTLTVSSLPGQGTCLIAAMPFEACDDGSKI